MKLHLGCGDVRIDGYVNIDCRYQPGVDMVDNIRFLRSFRAESVDVIYCSSTLEHFSRWEYNSVLKRWYEILKKGGFLRISVPNFESIVAYYLETRDLKSLIGLIYGGQDHELNYHHYIWDFHSMEEDLLSIGFAEVRQYDWRATEHADVDDFSQAYLPHMDKVNGKLMCLNVEATK